MSLSVQDVINCSFDNWYPKFKKSTIHSEIMELPPPMLAYFRDTGTLVLPSVCHINNGTKTKKRSSATDDLSSEDEEDWTEDEAASSSSAASTAEAPGVAEFLPRLRAAIARLGGAVFPKLAWTAPQDAIWMSYTNSMKCCSPSDVLLLLKSSNLITRDLFYPFEGCSEVSATLPPPPVLVLRRWIDINPSTELRCFVKDGHFMGLCPRDISQNFAYLGRDRISIVADITSFWRENIDNRIPLRSYVFDVMRDGKESVVLIDFSPLHEGRTKPLLFEWEELAGHSSDKIIEDIAEEEEAAEDLEQLYIDSNRVIDRPAVVDDGLPEFRYINQETGVQPSHNTGYGIPVDFKDLCSGKDPNKLVDLLQLKVQSQQGESNSSDEEPSS